MNTRFLRLFLVSLLACVITSASALAQDMGVLRERMAERLPQIDRLKAEGVIGETNDGFVAVRGSGSAEAAQVVATENADRKAVYAAIAQKAGASAESVASARARQIAAGSAPGVWLQNERGEWYKK